MASIGLMWRTVLIRLWGLVCLAKEPWRGCTYSVLMAAWSAVPRPSLPFGVHSRVGRGSADCWVQVSLCGCWKQATALFSSCEWDGAEHDADPFHYTPESQAPARARPFTSACLKMKLHQKHKSNFRKVFDLTSSSETGSCDFASHQLPAGVVADLRTDHAGETGAVCIYHGVLRFARDPTLRAFAQRHLATEQAHLQQMEAWLPKGYRSRLLPVWRLAGWLTGALPALLGPRAVYGTIEAVEQFVEKHYEEQIRNLDAHPALRSLRQTLLDCQGDETAHRAEAAAARGMREPGLILRSWSWLVGAGSRGAVAVCRYV